MISTRPILILKKSNPAKLVFPEFPACEHNLVSWQVEWTGFSMRFPNVFDTTSGTCRTSVGSVPTVTVRFWSLIWEGYTAMLVVSRKENQSIVFPALGISVNIVRAGGKTVRVGVDAPKDVRILRGELMDDTEHPLYRKQ